MNKYVYVFYADMRFINEIKFCQRLNIVKANRRGMCLRIKFCQRLNEFIL